MEGMISLALWDRLYPRLRSLSKSNSPVTLSEWWDEESVDGDTVRPMFVTPCNLCVSLAIVPPIGEIWRYFTVHDTGARSDASATRGKSRKRSQSGKRGHGLTGYLPSNYHWVIITRHVIAYLGLLYNTGGIS